METPRSDLASACSGLALLLSLAALSACSSSGPSHPGGGGPDGGVAGALTTADGITEIAVSGDALFYVTNVLGASAGTAGGVYRTSLPSGATDQLDFAAFPPSGLRLGVDHAYWLVYDTASAGSTVKRVPFSGGAPEIVAKHADDSSPFLLDGDNVYYLSPTSTQIGIAASPLAGGTPTMLMAPVTASAPSWLVALDATRIYFFSSLGDFGAMPGLYAVPLAGGAPTLVQAFTTAFPPRVTAQDAQSLYFSYGNDVLDRMPLGGGAPVELGGVVPPGDGIGALAIDGAEVYLSTGTLLERLPGGGGATETLLQPSLSVVTFSLTPDAIYWAGGSPTADSVSVFKLTR